MSHFTSMFSRSGQKSRPWGLKWRSSAWFVTTVVGMGIATDLVVYTVIIPVVPFQLERLAYTGVSGLVGWLLFAYSGGLVLSTIPVALLSERYSSRRTPLIFGQIVLIGSQIMFMEAPAYWVMVLARVIQGISSAIIWTLGLALLCDTSPEQTVGQKLGAAMSGLSIGGLVGPPVGGALYKTFGFRGPFIFGIIITVFDLIGRLIIIERKDAICWGVDPKTMHDGSDYKETNDDKCEETKEREIMTAANLEGTSYTSGSPAPILSTDRDMASSPKDIPPVAEITPLNLSPLGVVIELARSSRAMTSLGFSLAYGLVYASQEPTLPLHLQDVWKLNSSKVGLIYIAAVVPSLLSSPLTGMWVDRHGTEWITAISLLLTLPWWILLIIEKSLALFIVIFACQNFFTTGLISPITAELAAVSRGIDGVGYAHVYGAFNLCYGIGSAVGPVIGGQIYDHVRRGWLVICLIAAGIFACCFVFSFFYVGQKPLRIRVLRLFDKQTWVETVGDRTS